MITSKQLTKNQETEEPKTSYFIKLKKPAPQKKTKTLILDSGTIINLSMNGLLYLIPALKKSSNVKFLITKDVKYEILERPIAIPRFQLEALRVQQLLNNKDIELPDSVNVPEQQIKNKRDELMNIANHSLKANGKWINIVSNAEISCLALSSILTEKGIENIIAVDERTTRMLSEKPQNLEKLMSRKLHQRISLEANNFKLFKNFKFIRSTELVFVAAKKGLLHIQGPKALEAALYATKFKGSSVSWDEIKTLKKL
jgi:hypothetical protein